MFFHCLFFQAILAQGINKVTILRMHDCMDASRLREVFFGRFIFSTFMLISSIHFDRVLRPRSVHYFLWLRLVSLFSVRFERRKDIPESDFKFLSAHLIPWPFMALIPYLAQGTFQVLDEHEEQATIALTSSQKTRIDIILQVKIPSFDFVT